MSSVAALVSGTSVDGPALTKLEAGESGDSYFGVSSTGKQKLSQAIHTVCHPGLHNCFLLGYPSHEKRMIRHKSWMQEGGTKYCHC